MKTPAVCKPRTAVSYARYSSAGQRDVSIEQQLADIHAYADREGYTLVHDYADHARSGFKNSSARSEFQAMLSDAAARGFDTVLCWKVDRFGRNRADSAIYKQQLAKLGISVVYVMEPIPTGAAGVLTEGMLEAIAEWYSRNLAENVTRGMRDNAVKCLYNGTKIIGYTRGPDGRYALVPEEAAVVRRIFARYLSGLSAAAICRELNAEGLRTSRGLPFSVETVLRIVSNERYTGVYIWGDVRVPGGMPMIITHKDWEAAQLMKRKTTRHLETRPFDFLLTGKAWCGHCGRAMIGDSGRSRNGSVHYYYTCQGHKARTGCDKKAVRKDLLESLVIDFIFEHCLTDPEIERIADAVMAELDRRKQLSPLSALESELAEVEKKIKNTNRAIASGIFGESTLEMLNDLEDEAKRLRDAIAKARYTDAVLIDRDHVLFFLHRFARLDRHSVTDKKLLIRTFLNAVYVYDDHLKIVINAVETDATVRLPAESIPDPPGSDSLASGVLITTHPNQIALWYITRM